MKGKFVQLGSQHDPSCLVKSNNSITNFMIAGLIS